jgi:diguanylate cyclase (GGDEF)-like protein
MRLRGRYRVDGASGFANRGGLQGPNQAQWHRSGVTAIVSAIAPYVEQDAVATPTSAESGEGLAALARCFAEEIGADTALLVRWSEQESEARVASFWGADPVRRTYRPGRGFVGRMLLRQQPRFEALNPDDRMDVADPWFGDRVTHAVGTPIRSYAGLEGALGAGFRAPPRAEAEALLWTASAYAAASALAFGESRLLSRLLHAARYDGLTGVLNYMSLREALEDEIERCERHGRPLCCCFVDLDSFKGVNDSRGHQYGNLVLSTIGGTLRRCLRSNDRVGRYGGDEFVLVLPETDMDSGAAMARRVRDRIRAETAVATGQAIDASIGLAPWTQGVGADDLLTAADRALWGAKSNGGGVSVEGNGLPANGNGLPANGNGRVTAAKSTEEALEA